jgi:hypothetical protein
MHDTLSTSSEEIEQLRERVAQLQHALDSRIVIEQAKGVLSERYRFSIDDAFALLRYSARSSRIGIHELAAEVVVRRETPRAIVVAAARQQRWRAVAQRERSEAIRERATRQIERTRERGAEPPPR